MQNSVEAWEKEELIWTNGLKKELTQGMMPKIDTGKESRITKIEKYEWAAHILRRERDFVQLQFQTGEG